MTVSVCLVDDQTLVRQGIRSLLELSDDIRIVAEAADGAQAVEMIPRAKPDVVLLDMRMPGMSGLDVLNALAEKSALPPTITFCEIAQLRSPTLKKVSKCLNNAALLARSVSSVFFLIALVRSPCWSHASWNSCTNRTPRSTNRRASRHRLPYSADFGLSMP